MQGVWFRESTRREAERLGIRGHAINLPDGTVEVLAIGLIDALTELEQWLQVGPPIARVTKVDVQVVEATDVADFRTG